MTRDPLGRRAALALSPAFVSAEVARFLAEDVGDGDRTTRLTVPPGTAATAAIVARQPCVVAGLDVAREVFRQLDAAVVFQSGATDSDAVAGGHAVARLSGSAAALLTGERTALNILQRLSGIATLTRRYVDAIAGTGAVVSDTRKTTPGLRLLEKYAVRAGGGRNHRIGLFDAVLVKDNHVVAAGGMHAILAAMTNAPPDVPVQVEVDSLRQLAAVLEHRVGAVLLDNMSPETVREAVSLVRAAPGGDHCWIEASGGITLANIRAYADAGVDTISIGALTHSSTSVDLALDFTPARTRDGDPS